MIASLNSEQVGMLILHSILGLNSTLIWEDLSMVSTTSRARIRLILLPLGCFIRESRAYSYSRPGM